MEAAISFAFCLLIGGVGVWTGFKQLKNHAALNHWLTTRGKVIERGTYQPDVPALGSPGFRYAPLVKYVYQVDGREFVNDSIRPKRIQLPQHNTLEWARKKAASFADEVTVHYNPEDPGESFLDQTPKVMLYIVIVASCLMILFGMMFLLIKWA
jgi:hypothetical protein